MRKLLWITDSIGCLIILISMIFVPAGATFDATESPDTEVNIDLDLTPSSGNATLIKTEDPIQVKEDLNTYRVQLVTSDGSVQLMTDPVEAATFAEAVGLTVTEWHTQFPNTVIVGVVVEVVLAGVTLN